MKVVIIVGLVLLIFLSVYRVHFYREKSDQLTTQVDSLQQRLRDISEILYPMQMQKIEFYFNPDMSQKIHDWLVKEEKEKNDTGG